MPLPPGVYRADHVGSFLRPAAVKRARKEYAEGTISATQLRAVEDQSIVTIVENQLKSGLRSITDGEARRAFFHLDFLRQLGGVKVEDVTDPTSRSYGYSTFRVPAPIVTGKLTHVKPIQVADFKFLDDQIKARASQYDGRGSYATPKVCIPSPTLCHFKGGRAAIDMNSYPDLEAFFTDLARVFQQELAALYEAGTRFVQLDDPNLTYFCDEKKRGELLARNDDPITLAKRYTQLINESISKKPADMKIGIHLCRGNYKSQWFASGGYELVAEIFF